jgi:hypothetical protein
VKKTKNDQEGGEAQEGPERRPPRRAPKRRGRPVGTVRLTPEIQQAVVSNILAGCYEHVAATLAGIDARTFRDWMARGEGRHPTRSSTPALREFAKAVRQAKAQARAAAEIRIARADPKFWLQHVARSKAGAEGWTEPVADEADPSPETVSPASTSLSTPEEAAEVLSILAEAGAFPIPDKEEVEADE